MIVRTGKHILMEKDGHQITIPSGAKMGRRAESGIRRVLLGRPTTREGWMQRLAVLALVFAVAFSACNYDLSSVPRPDGLRADAGGDEMGKQPPERPPVDGGGEPMPDSMSDSMSDSMPMPDSMPMFDAAPEVPAVDVMPEAPPVACDEVANTGCAAPLKCGFSCSAGGFTCIMGTTSTMRYSCKLGADDVCGPSMGCASPPDGSGGGLSFCLFYCRTDADCVGTPGRPMDGGAATCRPLPATEFGGDCSRAGHKVCW